MKFLVVGLGSMGKRRIRNLQTLNQNDIIGFDVRKDRCEESKQLYGIQTFSNFDEAIKEKPSAMIISTPPDLHMHYALLAIKNHIPIFMELNLLSKDLKNIIKQTRGNSLIVCSSCTMRYHPVVKELKKLLNKKIIGKILSINHQVGHNLANWHPWEDYREFFVSKKETGGAKELATVELTWLTYLFNRIDSVFANTKKISNLAVEIDDIYHAYFELNDGSTCNFTVDVFSIPSFKETKIIGEKGTIYCDFNLGLIKFNKGQKWQKIQIKLKPKAKGYRGTTPPESLYEEEMKVFLNTLHNKKKYPYSLNDELKILKIVDAMKKSSNLGKKIIIPK